MQDEGRYGMHSFTRRVWTLHGVKLVVPMQHVYRWFYVFAALECTQGGMRVAHWENVDLDITRSFFNQIACRHLQRGRVPPQTTHPIHELPAYVHVIQLPDCNPELNPVEGLWDTRRDEVCKQVFATVEQLQERLTPALAGRWQNASKVMGLVHGWIRRTVMPSSPYIMPNLNCN